MNFFFNERHTIEGGDYVPTQDEFIAVIQHLTEILKSLRFYPDAVFHYSSNDLKKFFEDSTLIAEMVSGNFAQLIDRIRISIDSVNRNDWSKSKKQPESVNYFYQMSIGESTFNVTNTTLAEAAEYLFQDASVAVINIFYSNYNDSLPIHINRSKIIQPREMIMLAINAFKETKEVIQHLVDNRIPREYNHNQKHGENGSGVKDNKYEVVSPLECSIKEASDLLKTAVTIAGNRQLYNFDIVRNKFIVFMAESQNKYHAFHPINQSEIPEVIKKYFLSRPFLGTVTT